MMNPNDILSIEPVQVGSVVVLGYSKEYQDPVVSVDGGSPKLLEHIKRADWDRGRPFRLSEDEEEHVHSLVSHLASLVKNGKKQEA